MAMIVTENAFTSKQQAIEEIRAANLWLVETDVEPRQADAHWHEFYSQTYVLEGQLKVTDVASGIEYVCGTGTRMIVPPRTVHSENIPGAKVLFGLSIDPAKLGEELDRNPAELKQDS